MIQGRTYIIRKPARKALLFAGLAVLMVIVALGTAYVSERQPSRQDMADHITSVLREKEDRANQVIEKILALGDGRDTAPDILRQVSLSEFKDQGIIYLWYVNDTLRYWTDNAVAVPETYREYAFPERFGIVGRSYFKTINKQASPGQRVIALILVRKLYPYQNDYLEDYYQADLDIPDNYVLAEPGKEGLEIKDADGSTLFTIAESPPGEKSAAQAWILFGLYLSAFIFLSLALYQTYLMLGMLKKYPFLLITGFIIDLLIFRAIVFYTGIPEVIHNTEIFSPMKYAASWLFPSFGDLILHAFVILMAAWVVFRHLRINTRSWVLKSFLLLLSLLLFYAIHSIYRGLIIHSGIPIDPQSLFSLNVYSYFSYAVIASLLLAFFLFTFRMLIITGGNQSGNRQFYAIFLPALLLYAIPVILLDTGRFEAIVFPALMLPLIWFIRKQRIAVTGFSTMVFLLFSFSLFATYVLKKYAHQREQEDRKIVAVKLSVTRDLVAEFLFNDIRSELQSDTLLIDMITNTSRTPDLEMRVANYLGKKYFTAYWERYSHKVTLCGTTDLLEVKPGNYVINCREYFGNLIGDIGQPTEVDGLYYLNYGAEDYSYLYTMNIEGKENTLGMFLEIYNKAVPKGMGYPELLLDKEYYNETNSGDYSYAIYRNNELVKRVGKFIYRMKPGLLVRSAGQDSFVRFDNFDHLVHRADDETLIVVSRKTEDLLSLISPVSYFFISFGLFFTIFILLAPLSHKFRWFRVNFRTRMQTTMAFILLVSFLAIGISTLIYIINLNKGKNNEILNEKAHSVLIEIEHKLGDRGSLGPDNSDWLQELLMKFSVVFFTDINMYDLNGTLLASSRPQIFEEALISGKMNTEAWQNLNTDHKSLFIQKESIGNYSYLSAYIPFRNNRNELIAYLNLPYFARESELKKEISDFLMAFINIYVLLIAISIFFALVISGYVTKPLRLLGENIRKVRLGKSNEKIEWGRGDEIGNLVMEYNRMVDQLAESAELLAKSERESAWREMAKQVAHEIKNPLTPMKLSVQYIRKAWHDKSDDWEIRLNRFTDTIIEQIDSLSRIASEFSDFAVMPQNENKKINIAEVINNAIGLYKNIAGVEISFQLAADKEFFVFADDKQMLRVFNNLIKNSVQATANKPQGRITINITQEKDKYVISVNDNGVGISPSQAQQIFTPYFTTKSSGTGLGLAMARNIVISSGGRIWFESEAGRGSTFFIELPVFRPSEIMEGKS